MQIHPKNREVRAHTTTAGSTPRYLVPRVGRRGWRDWRLFSCGLGLVHDSRRQQVKPTMVRRVCTVPYRHGYLHMGISQKWLGGGPGGPSLTRSGYRMDGVSIGAMWATVTGCGMEPEPDGMGWGMGKSGEMSKSQFARRASHASACGMWDVDCGLLDVDARTASLLRVVLAWPVRRPAAAAAVRASAVQKCPPTTHQFLTVVPVPRPNRHATPPSQSSSQAVPTT